MASGTGCIIVSNTKIGGCALLGSQSIGILPSCNRGGGGRSTLPMRSSKIQNHHHHHRSCLVLAQSRADHTQQQQRLQSESNICSTLLLPSSSLMTRQLEAAGLPSKQAETIVELVEALGLPSLSRSEVLDKISRQLKASGLQFKQISAVIDLAINVAYFAVCKEMKKVIEMHRGRDKSKTSVVLLILAVLLLVLYDLSVLMAVVSFIRKL